MPGFVETELSISAQFERRRAIVHALADELLTRIMREGAVEGETQEPPCGTNVVFTTL